jgi:hypothetical protein
MDGAISQTISRRRDHVRQIPVTGSCKHGKEAFGILKATHSVTRFSRNILHPAYGWAALRTHGDRATLKANVSTAAMLLTKVRRTIQTAAWASLASTTNVYLCVSLLYQFKFNTISQSVVNAARTCSVLF